MATVHKTPTAPSDVYTNYQTASTPWTIPDMIREIFSWLDAKNINSFLRINKFIYATLLANDYIWEQRLTREYFTRTIQKPLFLGCVKVSNNDEDSESEETESESEETESENSDDEESNSEETNDKSSEPNVDSSEQNIESVSFKDHKKMYPNFTNFQLYKTFTMFDKLNKFYLLNNVIIDGLYMDPYEKYELHIILKEMKKRNSPKNMTVFLYDFRLKNAINYCSKEVIQEIYSQYLRYLNSFPGYDSVDEMMRLAITHENKTIINWLLTKFDSADSADDSVDTSSTDSEFGPASDDDSKLGGDNEDIDDNGDDMIEFVPVGCIKESYLSHFIDDLHLTYKSYGVLKIVLQNLKVLKYITFANFKDMFNIFERYLSKEKRFELIKIILYKITSICYSLEWLIGNYFDMLDNPLIRAKIISLLNPKTTYIDVFCLYNDVKMLENLCTKGFRLSTCAFKYAIQENKIPSLQLLDWLKHYFKSIGVIVDYKTMTKKYGSVKKIPSAIWLYAQITEDSIPTDNEVRYFLQKKLAIHDPALIQEYFALYKQIIGIP